MIYKLAEIYNLTNNSKKKLQMILLYFVNLKIKPKIIKSNSQKLLVAFLTLVGSREVLTPELCQTRFSRSFSRSHTLKGKSYLYA